MSRHQHSSRTFPVLFTVVFVSAIACSHAAPPAVLNALLGEWSGESGRTATGEIAQKRIADARRYWSEGDLVRGEIVTGGGDNLKVFHVTIVPRQGSFVKVVTPERGVAIHFIGLETDGGIAWTPAASERVRLLERITGTGDARRFETLIAESTPQGDVWKVADALAPATAALTSVIGGDAPAVELVAPVTLPSQDELALFDRIAALLAERNAARTNIDNLARELSAAWRDMEREAASIRTLKDELVAATEALKERTQTDTGAVAGAEVRARAAESRLAAAEQWAADLEKNLNAISARADEVTARAQSLEAEIATLRAGNTDAGSQIAALRAGSAQLEALAREANARATTLAGERDSLADSLQTAQSDLAALKAQEARLTEAVKQAPDGKELERIAAKLQQTEQRLASAEARRLELQQQLEATSGSTAALESKVRDAEARAAAAGRERNALADQLTAALASVAALQGERTQLAAAVQQAPDSAELTRLNTKLQQTESRLEAAEVRRRDVQAQLESMVAASTAREAEVAAAQASAQKAQESLAALTSEKAALEVKLRAATAQGDNSAELAAARTEIQRLASGNALLETQAKGHAEALATRAAQIETLESRVLSMTSARESSSERRSELEQALNTARAELAQAGTKAEALEQQLVEARADATRAREQGRQMDADLVAARDRVRELDAQHRDGLTRIATLERERGEFAAQVETLVNANPDARIASLETRLADTYARAEARQTEAERLKTELASVEAERTALARRVDQLASTVESQPAVAAAAVGEVNDLRRQLATSEAARRELESERGALAARVRETEVRLAAATDLRRPLAQSTPVRSEPVARPLAAAPAPTSAPATVAAVQQPAPVATSVPEGRVLFRMPDVEPVRQPPTRPTAAVPTSAPVASAPARTAAQASAAPSQTGANPLLAQVVRGLVLEGYRGSGTDSMIVVGGRPYRSGATLDGTGGLRFMRIDGRQLVFTGPDGAEYRRNL